MWLYKSKSHNQMWPNKTNWLWRERTNFFLAAVKNPKNTNNNLKIKSLYQIKKYIGSFAAAMGGVDAIAFTGGIGENQEDIRELSTDTLKFMGIEIDHEKNWHLPRGTEEVISTPSSKVVVYRIPTDEELAIAQDTQALC